MSFGPSRSNSNALLQYLTSVADVTDSLFYGRRYVLARLHQRQLALDTRLNVTFSPRMTIELFAQPFFASGQYARFKEFAAPRSERYNIFGKDVGTVRTTRGGDGTVAQYIIDPDGAGAAPAFAFAFPNPDFTQRSLRGNAVFRWEYHPGSVLYLAWTHRELLRRELPRAVSPERASCRCCSQSSEIPADL
jgi:hypothetical protein